MRKTLFFSIIMLLLSTAMKAMPVDANQAKITAQKFCAQAVTNNIMRKASASATMTLAYTAKTKLGNNNSFYVFNRGAKDGFVIVSAEDRAEEIIGYTDKGDFDYASIPANMKVWLDGYSRQIDFIIAHPDMAKAAKRKATKKNVEPLLGEIMWDQGTPYNDKCPYYDTYYGQERSATGCVATAMGQVMYYNRWPEKGTGSHSYYDQGSGKTLSAQFDSTTYKWDDMLPYVTEESSQAAKDAVSTLLFHVGVSVNMTYGESSGAYSTDVAPALTTYFGYDKSARYMVRDFYSSQEWEDILKNSLGNGHAAIYDGATANDEGHSFVCDGYNTEGYFHINWGWSGVSNGYFLLSALDPELQGTGGSSGSLAFNYQQDMIVDIQKAKEGSEMVYEMYAEDLLNKEVKQKRSKSVTLAATNVYNASTGPVEVSFGYAVVDRDSQVVARTSSESIVLDKFYGYDKFENQLQIPSDMKEGTYRAYLIYNKKNSKEDNKVRVLQTKSQYFTIVVTADSVFITEKARPTLEISKLTIAPDTLKENEQSTFTAKIKCYDADFNGKIYFIVSDANNQQNGAKSEKQQVTIKNNKETEVTFTQTLGLPGGDNYKLAFYIARSADGKGDTKILPDTTINIKKMIKLPKISLYDKAYFKDHKTTILKENIAFYVPIQNEGGEYKGKIIAMITEKGFNAAAIDTIDVTIPEGGKTMLEFKGAFPDGVVGNSYSTCIYNLQDTMANVTPNEYANVDFILTDAVHDGINTNVTDNSVVISMTNGMINIATANKLLSAEVYSAAGQMVNKALFSNTVNMNNTPSGTYLIVVKTDKGVKIKKMMK
jgi:hypothetical protein